MNPSFFEYRTEPLRSAAFVTLILVVVAVFMPFLLFQLMILCVVVDPGSWALTQLLRRGYLSAMSWAFSWA